MLFTADLPSIIILIKSGREFLERSYSNAGREHVSRRTKATAHSKTPESHKQESHKQDSFTQQT